MSYIGNAPLYQAFITDSFSGTGSQTAFTMSVAPANTASVLVAVSGVLQAPSTYSVSGTTLTFSSAPPSGTGNISVRYLGIPASGVTTTAYSTRTEFTATAGQTTFTTPSYTAGFIQVYRNGVLLGTADYTATNGTTVVLATGATAGDLVTTISFYVSSVLNAIPNATGAVTSTNLGAGAVLQTNLGTNVAGNGPAFSVCLSAATQSLASNTWTKVTLDGTTFNTASSMFSSSRFTPTVAGYYQFSGECWFSGASVCISSLYKNGSVYVYGTRVDLGTTYSSSVNELVYLNGSTDYIEMYAYTGSSGINLQNGSNFTRLTCGLVRAA